MNTFISFITDKHTLVLAAMVIVAVVTTLQPEIPVLASGGVEIILAFLASYIKNNQVAAAKAN